MELIFEKWRKECYEGANIAKQDHNPKLKFNANTAGNSLHIDNELGHIAALVSTARENNGGADLASRYEAFNALSQEVATASDTVV